MFHELANSGVLVCWIILPESVGVIDTGVSSVHREHADKRIQDRENSEYFIYIKS